MVTPIDDSPLSCVEWPSGRPVQLGHYLGTVWDADLTVVEREFTLVGVIPALDEFTDLAAAMHTEAAEAAHRAGRILAARLTSAAGR